MHLVVKNDSIFKYILKSGMHSIMDFWHQLDNSLGKYIILFNIIIKEDSNIS